MAGTPKLIVLSEKMRGKSFELTKDVHSVGRIEERDIVIKDPTISTHHCDFIKSGNTYILRDNGSTNGSRVNNVPITEKLLENSDILQLGGVEILYDCDDKSVTTITRTQTGIDLESTEGSLATVKDMDNFSPFVREKKKKSGFSQKIMIVVIILLAVFILALIFLIVILALKATPQPAMLLPGLR